MCVCEGGGGGGAGSIVKMFNSIFVSSFYYKTIKIRWKIYISVIFSCNSGGGGGGWLGGEDLNP